MAPQRRNSGSLLYSPQTGCLILVVVLALTCTAPWVIGVAGGRILEKLHLSIAAAPALLLGVVVGSMIDIPIRRIPRDGEQVVSVHGLHHLLGFSPVMSRSTETVLAVNVGGCLVPTAVALYEVWRLSSSSLYVWIAVSIVTAANIAVCWLIARPLPGVGIALPAFASPAVAIGLSWLLLFAGDFSDERAPTAFVAGVFGPLIGADLLHLRDVRNVSAGVMSAGGAGTFASVALSGILAAMAT